MQGSFAEVDGFRRQRKITRREAFLAQMEYTVPWRRLEGVIEAALSDDRARAPAISAECHVRGSFPAALVWVFGPGDGGSAARYPGSAAVCWSGCGREPDA